jgi:hypothetical protein
MTLRECCISAQVAHGKKHWQTLTKEGYKMTNQRLIEAAHAANEPERFKATYGEPLEIGEALSLWRGDQYIDFCVIAVEHGSLNTWYTFLEVPKEVNNEKA